MPGSRYVVGIDLGTTNSALAYVDTGAGDAGTVLHLPVPQLVQAGAVEDRPLLPSFLYLPGPNPAGGLGKVMAVSPRRRSPGRDSALARAGDRPARVAAGSLDPVFAPSVRCLESPDRQEGGG